MLGDANAPVRESGPREGSLAYASPLGVHVLSDDEVVLLSERDRFALNGRVHVALAPLLDGSRTADELVAALAPDHPPAHVHLALMRLQRQGLVVQAGAAHAAAARPSAVSELSARSGSDAPPELPASNVFEVPPADIGEVRALGVPQEWAQRLHDRVGASPSADPRPGLTVVLVDDYLREELGTAVAQALERGGLLLPVRPVGRWLWFGPLLQGPDAAPAWELFDARMRMNRYADVTALERGATLPLFPDDRSETTVDAGLAIAARLVAEILAGRPSAQLRAGMLTYDTVERRFDHHAVAQIAPPRTDVAPPFGQPLPPLELHAAPTRFSGDGGHRTCTPAETLVQLGRFVSPISGIISALDPVPGIGGMHVFSAVHPQARVVTRPLGRTLGRKGGAMGKGFQEQQARVSCIGEAIERYSGGFFGDEPRRRARYEEIAGIALHPEALQLFSEAQYGRAGAAIAGALPASERVAAGSGGAPGSGAAGAGPPVRAPLAESQTADAVPARFDASQAIEWVPASSLISGETRWLPAAYCYFGYGMSDVGGYRGAPYCVADSNGCAAGNTREEAILQGLMELIERDACGIAWYSRARRPQIDLDSFDGQPFTRVREAFTARGKQLHVLDLSVDTEVPVALAVAYNREDGLATRFALGCHLDPRIAVSRALSELAQLELEDPADDAALGAELFAAQSIEDQPHLQPADGPALRAEELPNLVREQIVDELQWCCGKLASLGLDVLVIDQTRPEVGFPVVRVAVPGLRHFWRRLAPGRLYDVPVALGWRDAPLREDELNPLAVLI